MLRKRARSHQKDQHTGDLMPDAVVPESFFHSDVANQRHKNNTFFSVPGLFVGFNPKSPESDSVRSPTSPLDFRLFSSFGNPFRCPKSQNEGCQKSWECSKVGLSIIESLDYETKETGKVIRSSDSKTVLFGLKNPNVRIRANSVETPESLPKSVAVFPKPVQKGNSDVLFQIGTGPSELEPNQDFRSCSLDSGSCRSHMNNFGNSKSRLGSGGLVPQSKMGSKPEICGINLNLGDSSGGKLSSTPPSIHSGTGSIPASEIELSEDYTCVRTHGPNAKVTHIFGDCILECHEDKVKTDFVKKSVDAITTIEEAAEPSAILASYPPEDFLKFCFSCHKELDGEDIYMYRGEKAFCSYACRLQVIEIEEEMEKSNNNSSEISDESNEEISGSSLFITS